MLYRKKLGFAVFMALWFRSDLKEFAQSLIFSRNGDTLLKPVSIDQVGQEHQSGLRDRSTELWTLFMFRLWEQQCMSVKPADAIKKAGLR